MSLALEGAALCTPCRDGEVVIVHCHKLPRQHTPGTQHTRFCPSPLQALLETPVTESWQLLGAGLAC